MTKTTNPNNAGRKWFDGKDEKEVRAKLKYISEIDASLEEMALFADISRFSLMRYLERHKDFALEIDRLRSQPTLSARKRVVKGIKENYQNAMDYLKRKKKNEFGDAMKVDVDENLKEILEKVNNIVP